MPPVVSRLSTQLMYRLTDDQYHKDMYLAAINNALQQKIRVCCPRRHASRAPWLSLPQGISESFDELVDQFNPKQSLAEGPLSTAQLRLWVVALSHVVSRLERCHSALVEAVVSMPWTTLDSAFVKSYIAFVGMLVSAKPEYLTVVLERVANGFTYRAHLPFCDAGALIRSP